MWYEMTARLPCLIVPVSAFSDICKSYLSKYDMNFVMASVSVKQTVNELIWQLTTRTRVWKLNQWLLFCHGVNYSNLQFSCVDVWITQKIIFKQSTTCCSFYWKVVCKIYTFFILCIVSFREVILAYSYKSSITFYYFF